VARRQRRVYWTLIAGRTGVEFELGAKVGLGIGVGMLPFLTGDPWGDNADPSSAGLHAAFSAIGAAGNFGTTCVPSDMEAAVAGGGEIVVAGLAAFLGGLEVGRGFNQGWIYLSGGNTFGGALYDVTHADQ